MVSDDLRCPVIDELLYILKAHVRNLSTREVNYGFTLGYATLRCVNCPNPYVMLRCAKNT